MNFDVMRPLTSEYAHLSERERALYSARMMFSQVWFEMDKLLTDQLVIETSPTTIVYIKEMSDPYGVPFLSFAELGRDDNEPETDEPIPVYEISYTLTSYFPELGVWSIKNISSVSGEIIGKTPSRTVKTLDELGAKELEGMLSPIANAISRARIVRG